MFWFGTIGLRMGLSMFGLETEAEVFWIVQSKI